METEAAIAGEQVPLEVANTLPCTVDEEFRCPSSGMLTSDGMAINFVAIAGEFVAPKRSGDRCYTRGC